MTGFDADLMNLVQKARGFNHEAAGAGDNLALAQALKLIAADVLARHEKVCAMQDELDRRLAALGVTEELAGVVRALKGADVPAVVVPRTNRWWAQR